MIPNEKIEQIKEANDIVDVISDYISLKKSGASFKALCPFHQEKTPSFMVSPQKQIFHCFGCNVGGNVFTFIQKMENITFIESVKLLAKRAGIVIDDYKFEYKSSEKEKILEINKEALKYFREQFFKNEKPLKYVKIRGISDEALEEFKIGYAPYDNKLFLRLKEKKFSEDLILKSWLCQKTNNEFIDIFKERLIFPIFNIFSEPIAFGGRVFDNSLPKYINSADTLVYSKGKNLYNLNNAKKSRDEFLVIVEGYMDTIRLYSEGIKNVVATLGTALTEDQIRILKRQTPRIVILYDMDEAGRNSAIRAGEVAFKAGLEVLIAKYTGAKDPDEFLKSFGVVAMKKVINEAIPFLDYKYECCKEKGDINNPYYKEQVLNEMSEIIGAIDNLVVKNDSVTKISQLLKLDMALVEKYVNKNKKLEHQKDSTPAIIEEDKSIKKSIDLAERSILQCVIISLGEKNEEIILKHIFNSLELAKIDIEEFKNPVYRDLMIKIKEYFNNKGKNILNKIQMDNIENEKVLSFISELLSEEEKSFYKKNKTEKIIQIVDDCIKKIQIEILEEKTRILQEEIKEAEKSKKFETLNDLLKEKLKLTKIIKQRGDNIE